MDVTSYINCVIFHEVVTVHQHLVTLCASLEDVQHSTDRGRVRSLGAGGQEVRVPSRERFEGEDVD